VLAPVSTVPVPDLLQNIQRILQQPLAPPAVSEPALVDPRHDRQRLHRPGHPGNLSISGDAASRAR